MARRRDYAAEYRAARDKARAAGFTGERNYKAARRSSRLSSDTRSIQTSSRYQPKARPESLSQYEYTKAYYDAWEAPGAFRRGENGAPSEARKHWFVDILGTMTGEEWDEKYGSPS